MKRAMRSLRSWVEVNEPRRRTLRARMENQSSIWLSQEACLGVKWKRMRLSLFRLSHWLPGGQTHPEVMQGTADFHHHIADALLPQADPVFDDAAALDTAVDMLDPQPAGVERLVRPFLRRRQVRARGFLCGHEDLHLGQREAQEAEILQQPAPGR